MQLTIKTKLNTLDCFKHYIWFYSLKYSFLINHLQTNTKTSVYILQAYLIPVISGKRPGGLNHLFPSAWMVTRTICVICEVASNVILNYLGINANVTIVDCLIRNFHSFRVTREYRWQEQPHRQQEATPRSLRLHRPQQATCPLHQQPTRINNFLKGMALCNGVFTLPDSDSYTDPNEIYKGYTGTNSDGDSYDSYDDSNAKKPVTKPPYQYWYWCQIGYSTYLGIINRNRCR